MISTRVGDAESCKRRAVGVRAAVREGVSETLSYTAFPREHWRSLRTNNPLERLNREVRRRTRVVGAFPDGQSALMLVAARLRHTAGTRWGLRRYMDMSRLREMDRARAEETTTAGTAATETTAAA